MERKIRGLVKTTKQLTASGLSADVLKWIAVISMCIDHAAAVVLKGYFHLRMEEIPQQQWRTWELWYEGMRAAGRIAFPLFAFLLTEGFYHTKSRRNYGIRLLVTAVCSESVYDLAVYGQVSVWERQNTVFTLFLGFLVLNIMQEIRTFHAGWNVQSAEMRNALLWISQILAAAAGCALACVCRLDYSWKGILLIVVFYFFYGYQSAAAAAGFALFYQSFWSIFAFVLLVFYNGKKRKAVCGKLSGTKYWFYFFYPLHLLILWLMLQILTLWF